MGFVNPVLPLVLGLALHALAQGNITRRETGPIILKSEDPYYDLTLPSAYDYVHPPERPARYIRSAGREPWAKVSAQLAPMDRMLPQNPKGITAEEILALVSPPPNATTTFTRKKWQQIEVGVIEYHGVVNDLPVIGLSAILPLTRKALRLTVYGADPLEKEVREDFDQLLAAVTKAETNWYTDEALRKMETMEKVTWAGAALVALYPIAWSIFFRGRPLSAHWLRTGWLLAIALLLFIPISSPAPTSLSNNLVVNALVPVMYIMLAIRRLKMGIDVD
jgi:hypothetical protein